MISGDSSTNAPSQIDAEGGSDCATLFFSRYYKYPFGKHYPRHYVALYLDEDFEVDGDLDKDVWKDAPWSEYFVDIEGDDPTKNPPADCPTRMKMRYSNSFLYVAALVTSTNREMVAKLTERNSIIFNDSDFEAFIDIWNCTHQYKEFEGNAINTVWNLLLDKPYRDCGREWSGRVTGPTKNDKEHECYWDMERLRTATKMIRGRVNEAPPTNLSSTDPEQDFVVECAYEIAFAIEDLKSLKKRVETKASTSKIEDDLFMTRAVDISGGGSNMLWRINFSRVEDEGPDKGHLKTQNWVWSPQIVWDASQTRFIGKIDMHLPDVWGYVQLAGKQIEKIRYDVFFPSRLVAMVVYYAAKQYEKDGKGIAASLEQLREYLPSDSDFWTDFNAYLMVPYIEDADDCRDAADYAYAIEVFPIDQSIFSHDAHYGESRENRLGVRVLSDRFTCIIEANAPNLGAQCKKSGYA